MHSTLTFDQISDKLTAFGIRNARQVTFWFVDEDIDVAARLKLNIYQLAANLDVIFFRVGFCSKLGDDLTVNRNLTIEDHFFSRSAGSKAGLGDKFLKSFLHKEATETTEIRKSTRLGVLCDLCGLL